MVLLLSCFCWCCQSCWLLFELVALCCCCHCMCALFCLCLSENMSQSNKKKKRLSSSQKITTSIMILTFFAWSSSGSRQKHKHTEEKHTHTHAFIFPCALQTWQLWSKQGGVTVQVSICPQAFCSSWKRRAPSLNQTDLVGQTAQPEDFSWYYTYKLKYENIAYTKRQNYRIFCHQIDHLLMICLIEAKPQTTVYLGHCGWPRMYFDVPALKSVFHMQHQT